MSDVGTEHSYDAALSRNRLPAPGRLLAVTLLVMLLSWCFWIGWCGNQQQARIDYFEQIGTIKTEPREPMWRYHLILAVVGDDDAAGYSDVTYVNLVEAQLTESDLRQLGTFTSLEQLSLAHTNVTDAGVKHLSRLTNLHTLYLPDTQVTDAGLRYLTGLPRLETLDLHGTQVGDSGLRPHGNEIAQSAVYAGHG